VTDLSLIGIAIVAFVGAAVSAGRYAHYRADWDTMWDRTMFRPDPDGTVARERRRLLDTAHRCLFGAMGAALVAIWSFVFAMMP